MVRCNYVKSLMETPINTGVEGIAMRDVMWRRYRDVARYSGVQGLVPRGTILQASLRLKGGTTN